MTITQLNQCVSEKQVIFKNNSFLQLLTTFSFLESSRGGITSALQVPMGMSMSDPFVQETLLTNFQENETIRKLNKHDIAKRFIFKSFPYIYILESIIDVNTSALEMSKSYSCVQETASKCKTEL